MKKFFERQQKQIQPNVIKKAYYIRGELVGENRNSSQILLIDSGADFLTLSKAVAEIELGISIEKEVNSSLKEQWLDWGRRRPEEFIDEVWLDADSKAIESESIMASGSTDSYLYPVKFRFSSGDSLYLPVNFVCGNVSMPILGRRTLWDKADRIVFDSKDGSGHFEFPENTFSSE